MSFKKPWPFFFITLIILTLLGQRIWRNLQSRASLADIQRRGALRVGLDASFPPFELLNADGQIIGLDADLARAIAADLGVETQFVNIGFDGLYDALKADQVDLILSGLPIDSRLTQDVAYSSPYFNAGQVLVSRDPTIQEIADLAGRSIAVEWGSLADLEARRLRQTWPDLTINPQPDPATALQYEIAIVDGVTALSQAEHRLVTYLTDEGYAAAVAIDNQALLAAVNRTLTRLRENAPPPCYLQVPHFGEPYAGALTACYTQDGP